MMLNPLRICIIGCGRVASHYVEIIKNHLPQNSVEVVACSDLIISKAEKIANLLNAKVYSDYLEMIRTELFDYALVLTESGNHFSNAKKIMELGKNVLIEKPVALLPSQAFELSTLATSNQVDCFTVFQNRYNPAIQMLKKIVSEKSLGHLVSGSVRLRWCRYQDYYEDGWHGTWRMDGGVICQQAIHHLDCLISILGMPLKVVAQMGRQLNKLEAEDTMTCLLAFQDGLQITLELTTAIRPEDFEASISIFGEDGYISVGGIAINKIEGLWIKNIAPSELERLRAISSQDVPTGYGLSHQNLLLDLIDRKHNPQKHFAHLLLAEDAAPVLQLIHAIYVSCENQAWINVADKKLSKRLGR